MIWMNTYFISPSLFSRWTENSNEREQRWSSRSNCTGNWPQAALYYTETDGCSDAIFYSAEASFSVHVSCYGALSKTVYMWVTMEHYRKPCTCELLWRIIENRVHVSCYGALSKTGTCELLWSIIENRVHVSCYGALSKTVYMWVAMEHYRK